MTDRELPGPDDDAARPDERRAGAPDPRTDPVERRWRALQAACVDGRMRVEARLEREA